MKSPTLFKEYIWLVNTILRAGKITRSEINKKWIQTDMSNGMPLSRSTFVRHVEAIIDTFGIIISCNRADNTYFIENAEDLKGNSIQNWMFSTLSVSNIISESLGLHQRILLESIPEGHAYLKLIIKAMENSNVLQLSYQKFNDVVEEDFQVEPYCIKLYGQRWYLLAKKRTANQLKVYALDRIVSLQHTDVTFHIEEDFVAEQYFTQCYGVINDVTIAPQKVVVRAYDMERYYMQSLPLHHSQTIVSQADNYIDFQYFIRPTYDFQQALLSKGSQVQVLEPTSLKEALKEKIEKMLQFY